MLRYFPLTGRLYLSDDTQNPPHVIFDTDEPFLCVKPTDFVSGTQVVPARTASSSGVDGTQTVVDIERIYHIAQIDIPGAKVVRGMMRSTWASNPEPGDNLWRQASGTHLDILDGVSQTRVPQSDTAGYNRVATMGGYTFEVNGLNQLILRERIVMRARDPGGPPTTFNRARRQATIAFRLLIGFFLDQDFSPKPVLDVLDLRTTASSTGSNTHNFTCSAGFPFPGRRLIALIYSPASLPPTSVTIGGVAATGHGGMTVNGSSIGSERVTIWSATVPTGTTVNVAATRSGGWAGSGWLHVELYGAGNITGNPTLTSNTTSSGNSVSHSVTVGANQIALIATLASSTDYLGNPCGLLQINNALQRQRASDSYVLGSGILPPGSGTVTVSSSWVGPSGIGKGIIAARWNM